MFSMYAASHFRQTLFSVIQSSCCLTFDAFRVADASFRLYCVRNNKVLASSGQKAGLKCGPYLLGEPPKIDVSFPEEEMEDEEGSESLPAIKIYDHYMSMRFLVCGPPCTLDACLLGSLEDGLNALLNIEIRGSKLYNRTSAPQPSLQVGAFSRSVVTMRCDMSTCNSAHLSLLVSGGADICFNDQLLENHIKKEIIENSQLAHAHASFEETKLALSEPIKSMSIACGASVFEVSLKVPTWACQVLRQLALNISYRSLVMLGIASIQGLSVASFDKEDAERLLFFCTMEGKDDNVSVLIMPPSRVIPPPPSQKRSMARRETKSRKSAGNQNRGNFRHKVSISAMRPAPHTRRHKILTFAAFCEPGMYKGDQGKPSLPIVPAKHGSAGAAPTTNRKTLSTSHQAQPIISLNPIPLKKHGCGRAPILACSEEEFLRDVMNFLVLRGRSRLVPQGGLAEFPDAILNANRLDLFNLYREVVSRGGFRVGNGINWKGQVFSKMRNHTLTNRMTGVGNTLKRHYETYLLEYELAHDDVDGECCLMCHSSAAGDWVNCGTCGEWAHFGCDRRQGLGAFKDYAKTDGLDYICPHCSVTNIRKKTQKTSNGY